MTTFLLFALLLARMWPIVELTPFLGAATVPRTVRLALAIGLAALYQPLAPTLGTPLSTFEWAGLFASEICVGASLGFLGSLVFEAARMAGGIIDHATTPSSSQGPFQRGYALLATVVFLSIGGHHLWLGAVAQSYLVLPPFGAIAQGGAALELAAATSAAIGLAVVLAAPGLATAWLVDVALSLVDRSTPRLQHVLASAPIRVLTVTAIVALGLSIVTDVFIDASIDTMEAITGALDVQ